MARPKQNPDDDDSIQTEFRPTPSNAPRLPPKGQRDTSLVEVLVMKDCAAVGVVLDPLVDEEGQPILDDDGAQKAGIVTRPLKYKERLRMERWCADIMAKNDHVILL